jgi:hypothetical protein
MVGGSAQAASASKVPSVEIRVIHGIRTDAGAWIDPELRDLPQLTRDEPFVRYNVYKLVGRGAGVLEKDKPVQFGIVDGRSLQLSLLDVTRDRSDARYRLRAQIDEPGGARYLSRLEVTTSAGSPFFLAGQSYQGGTLFLEIVIRS